VRHALTLHPDSVCEAVDAIVVDVVRRRADVLGLRYTAFGRTADLVLPPVVASSRADGLWEHSCFEAFLAAEEGEGYSEINLSPSTQWAGYRFDGYRSGGRNANAPPPRVEVEVHEDRFELRAALHVWATKPRRMGLSAVIEEKGGRLSYWALAHPPGAPDFHHRDCFAIELPPLAGA
jgi:hypothetical protein